MNSVVIIFTSMTGDGEHVAEGISQESGEVKLIDFFAAHLSVNDFAFHDYNGLLIGSYTWIGGEVHDEFVDFYNGLPYRDLTRIIHNNRVKYILSY